MTRAVPLARGEVPAAAAMRPSVHPVEPRSRWRRLKPWIFGAIAVLMLCLIAYEARDIDIRGAWRAARALPAPLLLQAAALAIASWAVYGCFDLLGRRYTGHRLPALSVWATAFASYIFNLNFGSIVGGIALRLRLYARQGLDEAVALRVLGFSLATNWLGYAALAGGVFASGWIRLPPSSPLPAAWLQPLGVVMVAVALGYIAACFFSPRREWQLPGRSRRRLALPSGPLAAAQVALAAANWALMGAVVYVLLGSGEGSTAIDYPTALGTLMLAGVAGIATHIPAGLGVLEGVFLALLSSSAPQSHLLAALLAYRAIYFLSPLPLAAIAYLVLERRGERDANGAAAAPRS